MARVNEVIKRTRIEATVHGVDEAATKLRGLGQAHDEAAKASKVHAEVTETSSRRQLSAEAALSRQERRLDTVIRANREYEASLRVANRAIEQNPELQERANNVIVLARHRLDEATKASEKFKGSIDKYAGATGLARHEMINMSRQIQDVGVSLASGQSPLMVLVQQGTQIADIMATSQGSMRGFFGQVAEGARSILTPTRLALGGIAAIATGGVAAMMSWQDANKEITRSLAGIGQASGVTVKDIQQIAAEAANVGKGSFGSMRDAATAIASFGTIGRDNVKALTLITKDLAATLDKDIVEAAKEAGSAIADIGRSSMKGMEDLSKRFNFSGTTMQAVQDLLAMGKATEAQAVAIGALSQKIVKADEVTGFWDKTWQNVMGTATELWTAAGAGLTSVTGIGASLGEQYTTARKELERLQEVGRRGFTGFGMEKPIEDAIKKVQELEAALIRAGTVQRNAVLDRMGGAAKTVADTAAPEFKELDTLRGARSIIQTAMADPEIRDRAGAVETLTAAEERLTAAINNRTAANGMAITQEQQALSVHQATIDQINARTAAEREAAAAAAARAQAPGSNIEGALLEQRAVEQVRETRNAAHQDAMTALQGQLAVNQAVTGAERMKAQEAANYVQLINIGRTPQQAIAEATQMTAVAQAQVNSQVRQGLLAMRDQLPVLSARTNADRIAAQEVATYNSLIRQSVPPSLAASFAAHERANAEATATANVQGNINALNDQTELIYARLRGTEAATAGEIAYKRALEATGDSTVANAARAATLANERAKAHEKATRNAEQERKEAERLAAAQEALNYAVRFIPSGTYKVGTNLFETANGYSQFRPEGYQSSSPSGALAGMVREMQSGLRRFDPNAGIITPAMGPGFGNYPLTQQGFEELVINQAFKRGGGVNQAIDDVFKKIGQTDIGQDQTQILNRLIELQPEADQARTIQRTLDQLQQQDRTLARDELVKQLTDKLGQLTASTNSLNETMSGILSPLYGTDPRFMNLGFRGNEVYRPTRVLTDAELGAPKGFPGFRKLPGMANGGSVTVPGGYSSVDNYMLPVASGEQISVSRDGSAGGEPSVVIYAPINISGPQGDRASAKETAFQMRQSLARAVRDGMR